MDVNRRGSSVHRVRHTIDVGGYRRSARGAHRHSADLVAGTRDPACGTQTLLSLLLRLQEEDQLEARRILYSLIGRDDLSDEQLLEYAPVVEPTLRVLDLIAVLLESKGLRTKPLVKGDWAPMIARCWQSGSTFAEARRRRESRPELWLPPERLGNKAMKSTEKQREMLMGSTPPRCCPRTPGAGQL